MERTSSKLALLVISLLIALLAPSTAAARVGPTVMSAINAIQTEHLQLPHLVIGPESVAFDGHGGGPYVSVSDGRILKYGGKETGWTTFAYSPSYVKNNCSSYATSELPSVATESLCGRPLGLRFHRSSGYLYIADAYMGLMRVGPDGGEATVLATEAAGVPLSFTNGVDVDQVTVLAAEIKGQHRRPCIPGGEAVPPRPLISGIPHSPPRIRCSSPSSQRALSEKALAAAAAAVAWWLEAASGRGGAYSSARDEARRCPRVHGEPGGTGSCSLIWIPFFSEWQSSQSYSGSLSAGDLHISCSLLFLQDTLLRNLVYRWREDWLLNLAMIGILDSRRERSSSTPTWRPHSLLAEPAGTRGSVPLRPGARQRRPALFNSDFVAAVIKMGNIIPLTGGAGQIRRNCRVVSR
ncbi:hypothetical protein PR202_ga15212 [Eleusine coracana subsp. coracana]|uniref:Plant heme peroxidase family profile domain-containing protein n=1 Tax=Eleusine coracana subsp. coracana TaxID=191504 RepID=A0AAV5CIR3_ELECO|nr:hypothetical protein PR202_ga15212 [Eleusine coracana subsp. coracana]